MGNARNWIGATWLSLLACGGISQRGSDDDPTAGASNAGAAGRGSTHHTTGGGSPSSAGGTAAATGGSAVAIGGATMTPPGPRVDSGAACYNDVDCPGSACGGEVCNWTKTAASPVGMKSFYCNAAGTQPDGKDGWCTSDADCKCRAQGAKCIATYCSFTRLIGL